jgi:hypothetical protein
MRRSRHLTTNFLSHVRFVPAAEREFSAAAAIVRGATKIEAEHWTPLMEAFREWHNAHIEDITSE